MAKKGQKKSDLRINSRWVFIPVLVVIGALLLYGGYRWGQHSVSSQLASGTELEQARTDISNKFLAASSTKCNDPTDPVKPEQRVAVFYKYLRVNNHANRAVIRGCNDIDSLLMKTSQGWEQTLVNIALDTRANPTWQKACQITDITRADDVVRPENSSIDSENLAECNYMAEHNQVPPSGIGG